MATVADAVGDALTRLGIYQASEAPSAEDMAKGFSVLNILTDAWGAERLTIPYIARTVATLTANQSSFTVGTGGNINLLRPAFLTGIRYQDTSQSPTLELGLESLTDDQYEAIPLKSLTSVLPTAAYYNPTYASGFGTLIPWPIPTSTTLQWVIYSAVAVPQFAATSTTLTVPPAYHEFIVTNLAAKLGPVFGVPRETLQEMKTEAAEAKKIIKAANFRLSDVVLPPGALIGTGRRYSTYKDFLVG